MSLIKYLVSKQFVIQLAIAIVFLSICFFCLVSWLKVTTSHGEIIEVPDLSRLSVEEVDLKLRELNLRFEIIDSASYNPDFPKRSVISQSPEKLSLVKGNRKIYLTLNPSKYGKVQIQEFYGKTKNEVIAQLKSSGFKVGKLLFIPDLGKDVVRKLQYKGKTITVGDKLEKYSIIDVVLGDGKGS
ncbi:PASTA domain-containing protein [Flavicella sp.]|uniref:PASTA domain-containing protein n=1 Tax=Flavicella sp. TaxID=2957742 RepID=UPI0030164F91